MLHGQYLIMQRWIPSFNIVAPYLRIVYEWTLLLGCPRTLYKKSSLRVIRDTIGHVVCIDYQTDNGNKGEFTRMAVTNDLRMPLISMIRLNFKTNEWSVKPYWTSVFSANNTIMLERLVLRL
ncbi:hypothetical protein Gohar_010749, partial [Gossypium harknessii]|nr:hypothetical protein [Gossypium harknessii]